MKILITEEQLRWLIYEGKGNVLYYYRSRQSLVNILQTNKIRASIATVEKDIEFNKKRFFFVSTTRIKEYVFYDKSCRIYLDAEKLKQRYKIVPVSYFGGRAKNSVEYEERILLNVPYLIASEYISRIDVLVEKSYDLIGDEYVLNYGYYASKIPELAKKLNIPVYFFDNKSDYTKGYENKAINIDLDSVKHNEYKSKYKLEENDLILFFSIFYISQSDLYWFNHIDKKDIEMKLKYFYENKLDYQRQFLRILGRLQENMEYAPLLNFLGKTIRRSGNKSIYDFISKEHSKLMKMADRGDIDLNTGKIMIDSYILNGSVGNLFLSGKSIKTLSPLEKVKNGSLTLRLLDKLSDFGNLKEVDGDLTILSCSALKSLGSLERVGGEIHLYGCDVMSDFGALKEIGGDISITNTPILEEMYKSGELEKLYPQFKGKFFIW